MGFQIVEPTAGSTDWADVSTIINDTMQGFMAVSLTNYDTTDVPLIAAGGKVEVAGSLYTFASTEAITGSLSTNQNYILLTTSSSSITASYTSDVPTWVPSKHGWYDSSTGVQRYIGGLSTDNGGKWIYETGQQNRVGTFEEQENNLTFKMKVIPIGIWDVPATNPKVVFHTLGDNIRSISVIMYDEVNDWFWDWNAQSHSSTESINQTILIKSTSISLAAGNNSFFFTANFDSTTVNRGYITVWYEV